MALSAWIQRVDQLLGIQSKAFTEPPDLPGPHAQHELPDLQDRLAQHDLHGQQDLPGLQVGGLPSYSRHGPPSE